MLFAPRICHPKESCRRLRKTGTAAQARHIAKGLDGIFQEIRGPEEDGMEAAMGSCPALASGDRETYLAL